MSTSPMKFEFGNITAVAGPRQSGRTSDLIRWVAAGEENDEFRVLISANKNMSRNAFELAKKLHYDLPDKHFVSVHDTRILRGRSNLRLAIDDAEMTLTQLFLFPVDMVAITTEAY